MQFLRGSTIHLMQDLLPQLGSIMTNRIVNYLSFYLSYNGHHLYYSPQLHSHRHLHCLFADQPPPPPKQQRSTEHILAKMLLATNFQEHVIDEVGTKRMMADLKVLPYVDAKDVVESFLRIKCVQMKAERGFQVSGMLLPPEKRRNVYVMYQSLLPSMEKLNEMITLNPFYQLPNLNKVLVFGTDSAKGLQLPTSLEKFCHEHSTKIKLFDKAATSSLLQYLYNKTKGKILIHENINYDKTIYDLQTPPEQQRLKGETVLNPLNTRIMPQEVILMNQRLPYQSLATKNTEKKVLAKMRQIMELQEGEELIDPVRRIAFSNIQKNYRLQDITLTRESKWGFLLRRFATEETYAFRRKSDLDTPFTNPS